MKKAITILCTIGSGLIILSSFDFSHSLLLFLFAGIIPGTNITLPAIDVMAACATAFTIILMRLTIWPTVAKSFFLQPPARKKRASRTRRASV